MQFCFYKSSVGLDEPKMALWATAKARNRSWAPFLAFVFGVGLACQFLEFPKNLRRYRKRLMKSR